MYRKERISFKDGSEASTLAYPSRRCPRTGYPAMPLLKVSHAKLPN
jgi:hypothetical protein